MVGRVLAYGREDRDLALLYSQTMNIDIPENLYFIDRAGETVQLDEVLSTVQPGDKIIVGTITDFSQSSEPLEMLSVLEDLAENGVQVVSRTEPDYTIEVYRAALRVADKILNIRNGRGPIRTR